MSTARLKIIGGRIGIANAFARMPFRFGVVTMEAAASATLELEVFVNGQPVLGYASDLLAYKWFDKRPEKTPADNVADLLWVIEEALTVASALSEGSVFSLWRQLDEEVDRRAVAAGFNRLGASFGVSMVERAVIDALGRATGQSFFDMVRNNAFGIEGGAVFPELAGLLPASILSEKPLERIALRHTVGLVDPIEAQDIASADRLDDGLPETLADYIEQDDLSYLKIKIAGDPASDMARLERIASVMERTGRTFALTLDGNEQYSRLEDFAALMDAIRRNPALGHFYQSILFVEQPLERSVALSAPLDPHALKTIGKPLLIDEADGWTRAFHEAIALGYHGVSHKNCKGVIRSLLNAMIAAERNRVAGQGTYFQSAEDLTCLPVVSLQADLAVVAALGITHVERNGHHYFRGLEHLPASEAEAALAAHPDLYRREGASIVTAINGGTLDIASLQVPGMGFACLPNLSQRTRAADWTFDSLNKSDAGHAGTGE
ncbi:mandelate racemase [Nitratireductor kimnyeongensis]|uniref:Mandelate racemase n=1 Tax=Nitratireductor kimnyeongensis TaxID=430679 RepID=A0ABW0TA92_9HYPH|nr:mandelate racemase [Nitratireductor kimnyeongensis]QZZ35497.1 mandelate racemase [Nitratireductor kimnyeongensis]